MPPTAAHRSNRPPERWGEYNGTAMGYHHVFRCGTSDMPTDHSQITSRHVFPPRSRPCPGPPLGAEG